MNDGIFVAFLFKVEKDVVTFGFGGSKCDRMSTDDPTIDIRKPASLRRDVCKSMVEGLDKSLRLDPIATWQQFYTWLGRGHDWADFTYDFANQSLSHWFGGTEYRCRQQLRAGGYREGPFIDLDALGKEPLYLESAQEMLGSNVEDGGETMRIFHQFGDNFIITRKPIFML